MKYKSLSYVVFISSISVNIFCMEADQDYRSMSGPNQADQWKALGLDLEIESEKTLVPQGEVEDKKVWINLQVREEAVRLYRFAAEQGNAGTQNNLGLIYAKGLDIEKDYKEAARLFRLAADQGYPWAQFNLGLSYANGLGVEKNYHEAARLYQLAAEQGNAEAQENLG